NACYCAFKFVIAGLWVISFISIALGMQKTKTPVSVGDRWVFIFGYTYIYFFIAFGYHTTHFFTLGPDFCVVCFDFGGLLPMYFTLSVSQYKALSHPTILIICHRQSRVMLLVQSPHRNGNFFSWVFATSSGVMGSRYLTSRPVSL